MRLSHNIPIQELLYGYLRSAVGQCRSLWLVMAYDSGGFAGYSDDGEMVMSQELVSFLSTGNTGWYANSETPLTGQKNIKPKGLEAELERDHLLIPGIPVNDGRIYILMKLGTGSMSTNTYLNAAEKKLYESLIRGFTQSYLAMLNQDKQILRQIAQSGEKTRNDLENMRAEQEQRAKYFESHMGQILSITIGRLEEKHGIAIRYGKDFLSAVMDFKGPLNSIEQVLDKEVEIAGNLAMLNGENEVYLTPSLLKTVRTPSKVNEAPVMQLGRYTKTYQLLDRYEKAAEEAQSHGKSIIGRHIGEHCEPSISNAAITDALNKHSRKIFELFQRYPNRWNLLRSEFRSVANIIERETERRKTAGL